MREIFKNFLAGIIFIAISMLVPIIKIGKFCFADIVISIVLPVTIFIGILVFVCLIGKEIRQLLKNKIDSNKKKRYLN